MKAFRMGDQEPEARRARLDPKAGMALAKALETAARKASGGRTPDESFEDILRAFLFPFAEFGLDSAQMLGLLDKVPGGWALDHREIYYDFRLARWQKHIEPPALAECLDEYLENSPSREEGSAYVREEWTRFLARHGLK